MTPAGYSGTPLAKKLGIKEGGAVYFKGAPADFESMLQGLPADASTTRSARGNATFDVIVFFTKSEAALAKEFAGLARRLAPGGGLWIAWPKKTSKVATDLTEDVVRRVGLAAGLVDVKVCAIDEVWSGLRFMRRVTARSLRPASRAR